MIEPPEIAALFEKVSQQARVAPVERPQAQLRKVEDVEGVRAIRDAIVGRLRAANPEVHFRCYDWPKWLSICWANDTETALRAFTVYVWRHNVVGIGYSQSELIDGHLEQTAWARLEPVPRQRLMPWLAETVRPLRV